MQDILPKKKRFFFLLPLLLLLLCLGGCQKLLPFGGIDPERGERPKAAAQPVVREDTEEAPFLVRVLDVGQGLSVLVCADQEAALFDAGSRMSGAGVVRALKKEGIRSLSFVSASHYDDDHAGGVPGVLHGFPCTNLLLPEYVASGATYKACLDAAEEMHTGILYPKAGDVFTLGGATVRVVGPEGFDMEEENDRCLAYLIDYGSCHVLLPGDAEEREEAFISRQIDHEGPLVYVVSHHGSYTSSTGQLLAAAQPEAAVLSCGAFNEFAHPHREALERIRRTGAALYRTDLQGTVSFYSDGETFWFAGEPCQDFSEGRYPEDGQETKDVLTEDLITGERIDPAGADYVCNRGSFVFHMPDCENVPKIHSWNLGYTCADRETILQYGYKACRNCRP